jgi:methyltransferase
MTWFVVLVVAVGIERLVELVVSRRNAAWSLARGGREVAAGQFRIMVVIHVGLLLGSVLEVLLRRPPFVPTLGFPMLALVIASNGVRWWCIAVLGRQWNTRVIVVPGMGRVTRGPYRVLRHPNYVAVVVEGFALPLVHTAWITAVLFTLANAAVLVARIRAEDHALEALEPGTGSASTIVRR